MKAIVLTGHGGLDKLEYREDYPMPVRAPGEVLIKVLACGLNNTDVNTRSGWYSKGNTEATTGGVLDGAEDDDAAWGGSPITFPRVQGADVCGEVVEADDASLVGKRVMIETWLRDWSDPENLNKTGYFGSECDGGYAEYTKVDARNVHVIDSDLSDAEIATFATSWVTAENMLHRANVGEGDRVLIPGASGGVGSALIQLAHRRGATTIALCSEAKQSQLAGLGCEAILPRSPESLDGLGITVVADVVGGADFMPYIDCLERGGRYTCAGAIAGPIVDFDLRSFYLKDLTFTGATIIPVGMFADLVGYIERGEVKPMLAASYPLKDFHAAQTAFIAKEHVGNIVVTP